MKFEKVDNTYPKAFILAKAEWGEIFSQNKLIDLEFDEFYKFVNDSRTIEINSNLDAIIEKIRRLESKVRFCFSEMETKKNKKIILNEEKLNSIAIIDKERISKIKICTDEFVDKANYLIDKIDHLISIISNSRRHQQDIISIEANICFIIGMASCGMSAINIAQKIL